MQTLTITGLEGEATRTMLFRQHCQVALRLTLLGICLMVIAPAQADMNGLLLPLQSDRAINESTTLLVTNTAADSNLPPNGLPVGVTNTFNFAYADRTAFLNDGWSYLATNPNGTARDTESFNPAVIYYATGPLRIPCQVGDLWAGPDNSNNSRNSLFRSLPTNWVSLQLALAFNPTADFQQVHLALYQDDDNYVQAGFAYNDILSPGNPSVSTLIWEIRGVPDHVFTSVGPQASIHLRLDRNPADGTLTGLYSLDGITWNVIGVNNTTLYNSRLCIWTGIGTDGSYSGLPVCDLQRLDIISTNTNPLVLTYQLVNAPSGASIDAQGVISWTAPKGSGPSTNVFTTVVTDNATPPASATNSLSVVVLPPPYPVLRPQPNQVLNWPGSLLVNNAVTDGAFAAQLLTNTINFSYPDRAAFVADGWSFVGAAPGGGIRDTEVTSGGVVSYDQSAHPGVLRIPCDQGDLWGSANNTRNSLFHALPPNWLSARLTLAFGPTYANFQQAHLTLYQDDNNYLQVGLAYNLGRGGPGMTMDLETASGPNAFATGSASVPNLHFRLDRNPANGAVTGMYSLDGANWLVLGTTNQAFTNPGLAIWTGGSPVPYTAGMPTMDVSQLDFVVVSNTVPVTLAYALVNAPAGASIDANGLISWTPTGAQCPSTNVFTTIVTDNATPPASATNSFTVLVLQPSLPVLSTQPNQVINWPGALVVTNAASEATWTAQISTNTFLFTYPNRAALLNDGWSFFAGTRNTEITSGAVVSYDQTAHPGVLRLPCDQGDLWGSANNTRNSLFHALPPNWLSARVTLAFGPTSTDYQQAHLTLYQNDDNYTQVGLAYNASRNGPGMTMDLETGGSPNAFATAATSATNLCFRLDLNPANGAVTGMYSTNGTNWLVLGTTNQAFANPGLAIWAGGSPSPYTTGMPTLDVSRLDIVVSNIAPVTLSYALLNPPAGANIDSYGVITWNPDPSQAAGTYVIRTVAKDNALPPASATNSFLVTVKGPLTVTANDQGRAYGQANPALSATLAGVQNGNNITATGATMATPTSPPASYSIVPVINDPDGWLALYNVITNNGTLTVTQAVLTVTADNQSRLFSTPDPPFTATITGFVNGETAGAVVTGAPSLITTATSNSNVGIYPIHAASGDLAASNYTFVFLDGALDITLAQSAIEFLSSHNPSASGSNVTFAARLTPVAPATATPASEVQFFTNGVASGSPVPVEAGAAIFSTSSLPSGSNTVTAMFFGDENFLGSTNSLVQVVTDMVQPPADLAIRDNGDGTVSITFSGTPGAQYWLQTAPDLAPPAVWTTLCTNMPDATGLATFTDSAPTNASQFYRAAKP